MFGPEKCRGRYSAWALIAIIVLACTACEVDTRVDVRIAADGSGTVSALVQLDPAAVVAVEVGGGTLEDRIRLTDLAAAGWTVTPWARTDAGASIELTKPFSSVDAVPGIVAELVGPDGPIRDVETSRDAGAFSTKTTFSATLDEPASTVGIAGDADLAARLVAAGVDPATVDLALSQQARDAIELKLAVELPDGVGDEWVAPVDDAQTVSLAATDVDLRRIVFLLGAGSFLVLALLLLVFGEWRGRRRRARARPPA